MPVVTVRSCKEGIFVDPHEPLEAACERARKIAQPTRTPLIEIDGYSSRQDGVHHQPMAEELAAQLQELFAQDPGVRMDERKGGIVAYKADVVQVHRDALEFA